MKKLKFLTFILTVTGIATTQSLPQPLPQLQSGWERIYIKNVGSFDLPSTMEIQAGKYKQVQDEYYKLLMYDVPELTAQQKGLNERTPQRHGYARVIYNTSFSDAYAFGLNFDISELTQADINEYDAMFKEAIQKECKENNAKLIEWYSLKVEKINGMSCFHTKYKRQVLSNPIVLIQRYFFFNNGRMHELTLSYRLSEESYYKSDFETILKSFRITNIR